MQIMLLTIASFENFASLDSFLPFQVHPMQTLKAIDWESFISKICPKYPQEIIGMATTDSRQPPEIQSQITKTYGDSDRS